MLRIILSQIANGKSVDNVAQEEGNCQNILAGATKENIQGERSQTIEESCIIGP